MGDSTAVNKGKAWAFVALLKISSQILIERPTGLEPSPSKTDQAGIAPGRQASHKLELVQLDVESILSDILRPSAWHATLANTKDA